MKCPDCQHLIRANLEHKHRLTVQDILLLGTSPDEWRRSFLHREVLLPSQRAQRSMGVSYLLELIISAVTFRTTSEGQRRMATADERPARRHRKRARRGQKELEHRRLTLRCATFVAILPRCCYLFGLQLFSVTNRCKESKMRCVDERCSVMRHGECVKLDQHGIKYKRGK